jgi:hypothetical protein
VDIASDPGTNTAKAASMPTRPEKATQAISSSFYSIVYLKPWPLQQLGRG